MRIKAKTSFIFTLNQKEYVVKQGKETQVPDEAMEELKFLDVFNRGLIDVVEQAAPKKEADKNDESRNGTQERPKQPGKAATKAAKARN